jgi:hypothetical protein
VFAELGKILKRLLDAWQAINPEVRQTIVRMLVFASVATLVGGVLLAMVGAGMGVTAMFRRFFLNMDKAQGGMGRMATMLTRMRTTLGFMAAIGTISIVMNVVRKGDARVWDFLMGAGGGAMTGFAIGGPVGAAVGALVGATAVGIAEQMNEGEKLLNQMADKTIENTKQLWPKAREYGQYLAANYRKGIVKGLMTQDEFNQFSDMAATTDKLEGNRAALNRANTKAAAPVRTAAQAQKEWNAALAKHDKLTDKHAEKQKEYTQKLRQHKREMEEYNKNLATETVRAAQEATDGLRSMYLELQKVNEGLMGELFQGPLLGGESFDLAREWGITASIDSMIKDIKQANAQFNQLTSGFAKLRKIGIAPEMIAEIQKMEPKDALGFIQGILKGTPKQQQELIKAFKQRNQNVQEQTKMDFVDEIERFRRAGVSMGDAIKEGFQSAQVGSWFDGWVKQRFPAVISQAVNQAVSQWQELNPVPTAPKMPRAPKAPNRRDFFGGIQGSHNNVDNSTNETNIYVNLGDSGSTARERREDERRIGFVVRQATQGRGRVIGRPNTIDRTRGKR